MRSVSFLNGWLAGCMIFAALGSARSEVVLGPKLAAAPEISAGDWLLSELNCAACHAAGDADRARLGSRQAPLLGKKGLRLTPQFIEAHLADPSGAKPGTTMPDVLHHLPAAEKSEAVAALAQYLVSEQTDGESPAWAAEDYLIKQGAQLFHSAGCVACHAPQEGADAAAAAIDPALLGTASVPLGHLAQKMTVDQLAKFLADPLKIRPSGRMPSLNLAAGEAKSIAMYLLRAQAPGLDDPAKRTLVAGLRYEYFEENFHSGIDFDKLTPKESGTAESFHVKNRQRDQNFGFRFSGSIRIAQAGTHKFYLNSDDGSRLWIDGKLVVDNWGEHGTTERSGEVALEAGDHSIMATFYNAGAGFEFSARWRGPGFAKQEIPASVLSHSGQPMAPVGQRDFAYDPAKTAKGRELFASLGCASCHDLGSGLAAAKAKSLAELSSGGCLAENPAKSLPKYDLSGEQRAAIQKALAEKNWTRERDAKGEIAWAAARLNCLACHARDGQGGPAPARLAYFKTSGDAEMGDEGRIPPHLTGVGGKLQAEALRDILLKTSRARPYMATRMPQFGEAQVGRLPGHFERADAAAQDAKPEITQRAAKFGRRLAGSGGLSCIACHTVVGHKSLGIPAIDLSLMATRLRHDWFQRYLIDPPSLRPGTRMPSFWPGGEAVNRDILEGNTPAQINALWAYLASKPETDLPPGLVQGKKEIIAETEPAIYRNFIQGAGPRAIGVGYPEKVNLAWDANNLRLAMIWQGSFIDGSRHSSGRGEGFEPPLGNNVVNFPEGPQLARLADERADWPAAVGKDAGFRMRGYRLDEKRRPIFLYDFQGLKVEESFEAVMGEVDAYFRRTLRLSGTAGQGTWLRAAAGKIAASAAGGFTWNDKITLKFPGANPAPVLRDQAGGQELLVPVRLEGGGAVITQEIIW